MSEERFLHILCRDLGWRSVEVMLRSMSNRALMKWRAFYRIEAEERAAEAEK